MHRRSHIPRTGGLQAAIRQQRGDQQEQRQAVPREPHGAGRGRAARARREVVQRARRVPEQAQLLALQRQFFAELQAPSAWELAQAEVTCGRSSGGRHVGTSQRPFSWSRFARPRVADTWEDTAPCQHDGTPGPCVTINLVRPVPWETVRSHVHRSKNTVHVTETPAFPASSGSARSALVGSAMPRALRQLKGKRQVQAGHTTPTRSV